MSGALRAILAGALDPRRALALDEAIVRSAPSRPTLVLWRTSPAVVIGRFQRADWEVDAAACSARGVRVWRRFTGGGAVFLDPGTVCVGLALSGDHPHAALGVPQLYDPLLEGVERALRAAGMDAVRDERTVRVDGSKVTGIAAHRSRAATLVHGTVLADCDLTALRACLAGPRGGDLAGLPRPAPSRPDQVANVGVNGLEERLVEAFGAEPDALTSEELGRARDLEEARYSDPAWHAGPWAPVTPPAVRALLGS